MRPLPLPPQRDSPNHTINDDNHNINDNNSTVNDDDDTSSGGGSSGGGNAGTPYRVCFVCTGNICRSPMAEVVLRALAAEVVLPGGGRLGARVTVSSAGTGGWYEGESMDPRAAAALEGRGYPGSGHRARQIARSWLGGLDLLVALDRRHHGTLRSLAGGGEIETRLRMLRSFDPDAGATVDVPDPYYGEAADFERCLATVEAACRGLVTALASALVAEGRAVPGPATT